jgi:hypothetical protein
MGSSDKMNATEPMGQLGVTRGWGDGNAPEVYTLPETLRPWSPVLTRERRELTLAQKAVREGL